MQVLVKNCNIRKFGDFQCNASLYARKSANFLLYFTLHPIPFKLPLFLITVPSLFFFVHEHERHCDNILQFVHIQKRLRLWDVLSAEGFWTSRQCAHFFLLKTCISPSCAGIFKQSMGARNRVGIGLSYRPARLHGLAELVPWNRFLCSLKV